uniref:C2H2-type domain-containing protein n=1 Tax=Xenopus tropicalis TaxID=8364 RepID=A0A803JV09_XENTR
MGMWEEASDPVMGKKDKNEERKERILNLTLEIIYLLTGEGYVIPKKKSPTVGLGDLHAPGSVIQKENDKKILELISNIIQLLTGEVAIRCEDVSIYFSLEEWEYIKGNKALYREGIKEEEPQQLRPLDGEYEDKREIPADLGGTLCYNNEPSKIGAEGADFCADGNLPNPEISPVEQPPPANGIKEEESLWEDGNQSDCSINPLTEQIQGTDTPTPIMGCSLNNSSADNYISVAIKEEPTSCEESNQSDCSIDQLTEQTQGTEPATPILNIKEEDADLSDLTIITVSEPVQETNAPIPVTGCSLSANYISNSKKVKRKQHPDPGRDSPPSKQPCMDRKCEHGAQGKCNNATCYKAFHRQGVNSRQGKSCAGPMPFTLPEYREDSLHLNVQQRGQTEETPCSCSECGKCFTQISGLVAHQKTHSDKSNFSCSECGKCFPRLSLLNVHRKFHEGAKPYDCAQCGKCFTHLSDLNAHQSSHRGEKPFPCSVCGTAFPRSSELREHQKLHNEEKAFACTECGKCFSRLSSLTVHQISHTGDKPLSCSKCGKCFTYRSQLILHQRSHIGIKPYSCSECGKGFTQLAHLNAHYRVHQS